MAQRMESVAKPGEVMLSGSTARLVDGVAALGEPELVQIKGAEEPVAARRADLDIEAGNWSSLTERSRRDGSQWAICRLYS